MDVWALMGHTQPMYGEMGFQVMSIRRRGGALLLAAVVLMVLVLPAGPTRAQTTPVNDEQHAVVSEPSATLTPNIAEQLDGFRDQFAAIKESALGQQGAEGLRRDALLYRQDQRILEVLGGFVALGEEIVALPEGSPERGELAARLATYNEDLDGGFTRSFRTLEQRVDQWMSQLSDLSGPERFKAEAQIDSLNTQRLGYLEYMIDIVRLRKKLGFLPGELEMVALGSLNAYAEELMGAVQLHVANRDALLEQKRNSGDNADLETAIKAEQHIIDRSAVLLQRVVNQLERLKVDTTRERRLLLKQARAVTVSLVDVSLVSQMAADIGNSVEQWLQRDALNAVFNLLLFVLIVLIARLVARFARVAVERAIHSESANISRLLGDVLVSLAGGVILTAGFLIALSQVGVSVAPMLAGLGVAGFIIGFALQDVLGNFAAGAMILTYQPFDTGDYISVAGVDGTVKKMNLVSTTIVTYDNQTLIIPNSKIWGDVIRNYTGQRVRRVDVEFGISYEDSIEHAEAVLHRVIDSIPTVLKSPEPIIRVHRHNNSSIDFVVRPWVRTEDYWETYWAMQREVKLAFDAEGITIPFPQRDIHHYYPENAGRPATPEQPL